MVGKIYAGILVDREQGGFRIRRRCVDQIFTLKQISEKAQDKKCSVYMGFMDLEKAYERVIRNAL